MILRQVSFTLQTGHTKIFLGASGAGKSTILRLALGLLKPDGGRIFVNGERIDDMDEEQLMTVRNDLGMVFQEGALFDSLTVRENVGYKLFEELGWPIDKANARVAEVLGFIGLGEFIDRMPSELSGGQRRRVAIARAMAAKPRILLYDEPTTGLDPITAATVDEEIIKLRDLEGVSSVLVTHQLRDAFYVAEHNANAVRPGRSSILADGHKADEAEFIMLKDGRIGFEGNADELRDAATRDPYIQRFSRRRKDTMPRTRSLAWSELKIGILAVAALALAAMIIIAVGGQSGFFWERYHLKTKFDNVQGLKSGAIVRVAGVEVGKVTAVEFAGPSVEITLALKNEMRPRVTSDSRASIGSLSLLGEPVIDISPAATGTPLKDGDFIQPGRAQGQIADVAASASEGIDQLTGLLKDIRAGKGSVGKLFTDQQLYSRHRRVRRVGAGGHAVTSRRARAHWGCSCGSGVLRRTERRARQPRGDDPTDQRRRRQPRAAAEGRRARAKSLTSASANFEQITGRLNRGDNTAGKLLTEKELYDRVNWRGRAARRR